MSCCGGTGVTGLCNTCGCSPCSCIYQNIFQQGGEGSPATAGQCVNLSGICVLDAYNANTMYFRGIDTTDAAILSIALNATNHTIELTINVNALAAALPQATTSQVGVGETATDAEAQAKASIVNFVTPSNFAAMGASTTFAGFIEIATDAEAIAGASTSLAITPANLAAAIAANYGTTVTFVDSVARNAAVPAFVGQYGYQQDAKNAYAGFNTVAGAWNPLVTLGGTADAAGITTTIGLSLGAQFDFSGASTERVGIAGVELRIFNGGFINFDSAQIFVNGVQVPATSVITTNGFSAVSSLLISQFLTDQSTQTYAITNAVTTRTFDAASATLQNTKDTLATLIQDLQATQKPTV